MAEQKLRLPSSTRSMEEYAARIASDDAALRMMAKAESPASRPNPFGPSIEEDQEDIDLIEDIEDSDNQDDIENEENNADDTNSKESEEDHTEDWVLGSSDNGGIIKQADHTITFSFDGWINPKTGKPYNRLHYIENPVTMKFVSHESGDKTGSNDTYVNMVVTKNMAHELSFYLDNIYRSYSGMEIKTVNEPLKERLKPTNIKNRLLEAWEDHPAKLVGQAVAIVAIIAFMVYAMVF